MEVIYAGTTRLECRQGDITDQPDIDVIVNAANSQLLSGSGVAGAIHDAAGTGLAEECREFAPIATGEAVITSGHNLPNSHVIHCLGPVYGRDEPADRLLGDCYRHALHLADRHRLRSIAFPAISTGIFSYPPEAAARHALKAVIAACGELHHIELIRFVLFSESDLRIYEELFDAYRGSC